MTGGALPPGEVRKSAAFSLVPGCSAQSFRPAAGGRTKTRRAHVVLRMFGGVDSPDAVRTNQLAARRRDGGEEDRAMNAVDAETGQGLAVPCCPQLEPCEVCDTIDFPYRLELPQVVEVERRQAVTVEATLRFRLTRCSGPLSLGDLLYTTTLLPGEQVRLFTS